MSVVAAAVVGSAVVGGVVANRASKRAAGAQTKAADQGIAEQQRQFDAIQKLLSPYVKAGTGALGAQQNLIGLNGGKKQQTAINALQAGPQFQSMLKQGEDSILSNAAATGGLRGGNTQAALAQFSPALLAATINDQYAKLGGLSSMGLGAATQTGAFGQASANNVTQLLGQQGAAQAGAAIGQGNAALGAINGIGQGLGYYFGGGGGGVGAAGAGVVSGGSGLNGSMAPVATSPYSLVGGRF